MLIPVELVTPSAVAEGWTAAASVDFAGKRVRCLKGSATIDIVATLGGPLTEEEALALYELNSASVSSPLVLAVLGVRTSQIDHSDTIMPNGRHRYTDHHQLEQSGKTSFPKMELLVQFFYCEDLETSVFAWALIKEEPVEQFIREAQEMLESLQCP